MPPGLCNTWRVKQAHEDQLEFLGGKPELIRLGHFDDVNMAMLIYTTSRLWDDASGAYTILRDDKPPMSRAEYLAFQRGINRTETFNGAL